MSDPLAFHPGELAVQERVGVRSEAARVHAVVGPDLSAAAADFLAAQRLLVVGAGEDAVWASVLRGAPGFVRALDPRTVDVAVDLDGDPLAHLGVRDARVGAIAIDFAARRRIRLNGRSTPRPGGFRIAVDQAYGNCPRFITPRNPAGAGAGTAAVSATLDDAAQALVKNADTFFVATRSAARDVDASHRGGPPGFVQVLSPTRLRWPDFPGNNMFMTLGNLEQDPTAGLVFVDWATGSTLQLTGTARTDWTGEDRAVEFEIAQARAVMTQALDGISTPSGPA